MDGRNRKGGKKEGDAWQRCRSLKSHNRSVSKGFRKALEEGRKGKEKEEEDKKSGMVSLPCIFSW